MRCYRGNIAPSFSSYSGVEIHRLRRIATKLYNIMMHTGAQCLLLARLRNFSHLPKSVCSLGYCRLAFLTLGSLHPYATSAMQSHDLLISAPLAEESDMAQVGCPLVAASPVLRPSRPLADLNILSMVIRQIFPIRACGVSASLLCLAPVAGSFLRPVRGAGVRAL